MGFNFLAPIQEAGAAGKLVSYAICQSLLLFLLESLPPTHWLRGSGLCVCVWVSTLYPGSLAFSGSGSWMGLGGPGQLGWWRLGYGKYLRSPQGQHGVPFPRDFL